MDGVGRGKGVDRTGPNGREKKNRRVTRVKTDPRRPARGGRSISTFVHGSRRMIMPAALWSLGDMCRPHCLVLCHPPFTQALPPHTPTGVSQWARAHSTIYRCTSMCIIIRLGGPADTWGRPVVFPSIFPDTPGETNDRRGRSCSRCPCACRCCYSR